MIETNDWHRLHGEGWTGVIVPESFQHPAKFSRALIRRIHKHAMEEGWLQPGATVIDPFAGVALGALHAMQNGLHWVGVELEQKFVGLGQQNIDLWNSRYRGKLPKWGSAVLLQGDSRELEEVLGQAGLNGCISSPPWSDSGINLGDVADTPGMKQEISDRSHSRDNAYGTHPAQLGNMPAGKLDAAISSPPYTGDALGHGRGKAREQGELTRKFKQGHTQGQIQQKYGQIKGQLAAMPEGTPEISACISSPPYIGSEVLGNDQFDGLRGNVPNEKQPRNPEQNGRYGTHSGQLGNMPEGEISACISSPPYEGSLDHAPGNKTWDASKGMPGNIKQVAYGESQGNLGNSQGSTFWAVAHTILQQVYAVLKPGAPVVWVVKAFVRDKKLVDFPGQWRRLCESCGFETVHYHRAWLVEDRGTQFDLEGNANHRQVERKSFFRRLAEKKGSPRIDFEVALCMVKPC